MARLNREQRVGERVVCLPCNLTCFSFSSLLFKGKLQEVAGNSGRHARTPTRRAPPPHEMEDEALLPPTNTLGHQTCARAPAILGLAKSCYLLNNEIK
jgi:hypothetical protein